LSFLLALAADDGSNDEAVPGDADLPVFNFAKQKLEIGSATPDDRLSRMMSELEAPDDDDDDDDEPPLDNPRFSEIHYPDFEEDDDSAEDELGDTRDAPPPVRPASSPSASDDGGDDDLIPPSTATTTTTTTTTTTAVKSTNSDAPPSLVAPPSIDGGDGGKTTSGVSAAARNEGRPAVCVECGQRKPKVSGQAVCSVCGVTM
jgi:hypothetical protein